MFKRLKTWFKSRFENITGTIAFYPALISFLMLVLSVMMVEFDFSEYGTDIKKSIKWLRLKDASTARSIISSISAGVISLSVFSFSMVMIVLNQAASKMSNRVLDKLIGNRHQQIVLGIYVGTIVYSFFLLSTIRDVDSGVYIPAISIYLLILITIIDIFLFIYFLHYITQSVKYEVIIEIIFQDTCDSLIACCPLKKIDTVESIIEVKYPVLSSDTGIYEGFDKLDLLDICEQNDFVATILHPPGSFILKGAPLLEINKKPDKDVIKDVKATFYIRQEETIDGNFFYGFRQLTEIAVKAMSPGINDPGTAIISLRAIFELFSVRLYNFPETGIKNKQGIVRIFARERSFEDIFQACIAPIWSYGKGDIMLQVELKELLFQLAYIHQNKVVSEMLEIVDKEMLIQRN